MSGATQPLAIRISGVVKTFGAVVANRDASLDYAERDALRAAADAHYLLPPNVTVKVNIGCE